MNTNKHNQPKLTVIPGEGGQDTSTLPVMTERQSRFVKRFVPLAVGVGLIGTALASNEIDNSGREAKVNSAAAKAEAQQKAAGEINKLHVAGEEYTVTVKTGDGAEAILDRHEPAYNDSEGMRAVAIQAIEEQAPGGAEGSLQTGQTVRVPDLPGGDSALDPK